MTTEYVTVTIHLATGSGTATASVEQMDTELESVRVAAQQAVLGAMAAIGFHPTLLCKADLEMENGL